MFDQIQKYQYLREQSGPTSLNKEKIKRLARQVGQSCEITMAFCRLPTSVQLNKILTKLQGTRFGGGAVFKSFLIGTYCLIDLIPHIKGLFSVNSVMM